jgi:3'-phosphoadenosine 5'-phosphosulfate sulfotransferase (PAPS reductase)/FAD synthetase
MDTTDIIAKTHIAGSRILAAIEKTKPIAVFGLFSGGHDSVTATAIAAMLPGFTAAVHINTGIGIERTRQYVYDTAKAQHWGLIEKRAVDNTKADGTPDPMIYEDFALKHGFPGPHGHRFMYIKLKQRGLDALEREWKCTPEKPLLYITGARSDESQRRMANTEPFKIEGRRIWCAPIHDWTKLDITDFMEWQQIPRNPVVDLIHKSGECLCGAFAKKGELEELALWPETRPAYDRIKALEVEVRAAGFPWGWEDDGPPDWFMEKKHGQTFLMDYDTDAPQHLCWSCNKRQETRAVSGE